jgi:uncharacterized membrane protein YhiD involved in acid resistance
MEQLMSTFPAQWLVIQHALVILPVAALLGAALSVIRPIRSDLVPRSWHVLQATVLLSIVGAVIMVVVAENLARAFAIVGAAGLIRYRAKIADPKDAGVMLVALAVGLAAGSGLLVFAVVACAFVIAVLWALESVEPPTRARFELTIAAPDSMKLRSQVEQVLRHKGITYQLWGSSPEELHYEVVVPFEQRIRKVTKLIRNLDGRNGASVEWRIKKRKAA